MTGPDPRPMAPDEWRPRDRGAVLLQVRPRRMVWIAGAAAFVTLATAVVVGILLKASGDAGITFRTFDQVGIIGVGALMAAAMMTAALPRLRVYETGLAVRNIAGEKFYPWPLVQRITFPPGSPWAQLLLPDDEATPVLAVQAMDRGRAVRAMNELRDLHARFGPAPMVRPAGAPPPVVEDPDRPLGRLEIIDRRLAEKGGKGRGRRGGR